MAALTRCVILITLLLSCLSAQNQAPIAVFELEARGVSPIEAAIITDRLRSELIKTQHYMVMERELMQEILEEQAFQLTGMCSNTSCLVEVGKVIAVRQMVGGSIGKIGTLFTLQVRLVDVETGEVLQTVEEDYRGSIEMLLTSTTPRVARKLAGLAAEEPFKTGLGNCDLFIVSQPPDAMIYINDQPTGKTTPSTISGLRAGTYKVYLRKQNYIAQQSVTMVDGELKKITLPLAEARGQVRVITFPAGAEVYYGSQRIGMSPLSFEVKLKFEKEAIRIQQEGFLTEKIVPEFNDRFECRINRNLKIAGSLQISSVPEGAGVFLDGSEIGVTPLTSSQIPAGKHSLELRLDNYEDTVLAFEINETDKVFSRLARLKRKKAALAIDGRPSGAQVYIDETPMGVLPLKNVAIDYGRHELLIENPGYYDYEKEIQIRYQDINIENFAMRRKSRGMAVFYSVLLPGSGQIYTGYGTKGLLLGSVTLAGAAASVLTYMQFEDNKTKYLDDKEAYQNNLDLARMGALRNAMNDSYEDMENSQKLNNIALGITAALWLYNVLDAYLFFPEKVTPRLSMIKKGQDVMLSLDLEF